MVTPFKYDPAEVEVPIPADLNNDERAILRELAQPGNSLWKILRSMLDYREGLKQSLIGVNLHDQASINAAMTIQSNIVSIYWLEETFNRALEDTPGIEEKIDE